MHVFVVVSCEINYYYCTHSPVHVFVVVSCVINYYYCSHSPVHVFVVVSCEITREDDASYVRAMLGSVGNALHASGSQCIVIC